MSLPESEHEVINAVCETHHKLPVLELDFRRVALVCQVRQLCLDVRKRDRFDCLSHGHMGFDDGLTVGHIECVTQQEVGIEHDLRTVLTRPDEIAAVF